MESAMVFYYFCTETIEFICENNYLPEGVREGYVMNWSRFRFAILREKKERKRNGGEKEKKTEKGRGGREEREAVE